MWPRIACFANSFCETPHEQTPRHAMNIYTWYYHVVSLMVLRVVTVSTSLTRIHDMAGTASKHVSPTPSTWTIRDAVLLQLIHVTVRSDSTRRVFVTAVKASPRRPSQTLLPKDVHFPVDVNIDMQLAINLHGALVVIKEGSAHLSHIVTSITRGPNEPTNPSTITSPSTITFAVLTSMFHAIYRPRISCICVKRCRFFTL